MSYTNFDGVSKSSIRQIVRAPRGTGPDKNIFTLPAKSCADIAVGLELGSIVPGVTTVYGVDRDKGVACQINEALKKEKIASDVWGSDIVKWCPPTSTTFDNVWLDICGFFRPQLFTWCLFQMNLNHHTSELLLKNNARLSFTFAAPQRTIGRPGRHASMCAALRHLKIDDYEKQDGIWSRELMYPGAFVHMDDAIKSGTFVHSAVATVVNHALYARAAFPFYNLDFKHRWAYRDGRLPMIFLSATVSPASLVEFEANLKFTKWIYQQAQLSPEFRLLPLYMPSTPPPYKTVMKCLGAEEVVTR